MVYRIVIVIFLNEIHLVKKVRRVREALDINHFLSSIGTGFGSMISFALSGVLCADLGWPWVFYVYGEF